MMTKYDYNTDKKLSKGEVYFILKDLTRKWDIDLVGNKLKVAKYFNKLDVNNSGYLEEDELVELTK